MAYTKIIKVKSNLNLCLDYTSNPKKTERRSAEDLNRLLSYTQNNDKTEHQLYVSGFNCIPQNAHEIMVETKQRWRKPVKDGNILAYHIIQSFSPGEATPDQVHQIGCEFAQRFLADRFECTVSTHLDRGHLHNHIVVNSVSYKDGKMFRSDFDAYYKGIRKISDELCRENRLSVIETDGKGKSYDEWLSGQSGKPTIKGKCEIAGMKMEPFVRALVDGCRIKPAPPDSYNKLRQQLSAIGNNLNQLTHVANATGRVSASQLDRAQSLLEDMLNAGKIKAFRIGRSYRIPKVNVIRFLQNETPEDCNTVNATIDSVE